MFLRQGHIKSTVKTKLPTFYIKGVHLFAGEKLATFEARIVALIINGASLSARGWCCK